MDENDLNAWFEKLPLKRKQQLWRWLSKEEEHREIIGQIPLLILKGERS
ncbi:hypothetical protein [uncultured Corynebacterium sp.]|nr:hypothetical protein [uncultured Corynebacterium sp.]